MKNEIGPFWRYDFDQKWNYGLAKLFKTGNSAVYIDIAKMKIFVILKAWKLKYSDFQIFANLNQLKKNTDKHNCWICFNVNIFHKSSEVLNSFLKHCGSSPVQNLRSSGKGLNLIVTKTRRDEGCLNHLGTRYDTIWVKIELIFQPLNLLF